jgi:hypothetical protein
MASLILVTALAPAVIEIQTQRSYLLDAATRKLVGTTNPNLADKISYDAQNGRWQFNKSAIPADTGTNPASNVPAPAAAALQAQMGGGGSKDTSLYAVNMPVDGKKGIEYYDANTDLSFGLVPQFAVGQGIERNGQLIYAMPDGMKIVYSAKNNGMKEDIVLSHNIGNDVQFAYNMDLPETLEAKLEADGSIGVYSADPVLFTNITFGSDDDQAKVEHARKVAAKDHMLFNVPAPVIVQSGDRTHAASARFELDGEILHIRASGMDTLTYPVSIDPTVVVTSSSDFTAGNNEGNVSYPAGQISRGTLSGGTLAAWPGSPTSYYTTPRDGNNVIAYNGYMYNLTGYSSTYLNDVRYAAINTNGTVSATWSAATDVLTARRYGNAVTYNGYMYLLGGRTASGVTNAVEYAKINSDGTLGTWAATTSFATGREFASADVYNGYIYISGGNDGTNAMSDVQYAPLNADGTVGTWAATTPLPSARHTLTTSMYNGYMYLVGGMTDSTTGTATTYYARVNTNGTLDAWAATSSLPAVTFRNGIIVSGGYIYTFGGTFAHTNTVYYAPLLANGAIGKWQTTSSFLTGRRESAAVAYNGYVYIVGGIHPATDQACTNAGVNTTYCSDIQYTSANASGVLGSFSNTTVLPTTLTRLGGTVYNGYIYAVGGATAANFGSSTTLVRYAPLNADGSIGTWTVQGTNNLPVATRDVTLVAYRGIMYQADPGVNYMRYAPINSNGSLGGFVNGVQYKPPGPNRFFAAYAAYNGYMYMSGGYDNTASLIEYKDVQYARIQSETNGSLVEWLTLGDFKNIGMRAHQMVAIGGYMYIMGGINEIDGAERLVYFAAINADGTLGTWNLTTSMLIDRFYYTAGTYNGYIYAIGGSTAIGQALTTEYAKLNSDGTIGSWTNTNSLIAARNYHGGGIYNGYVYALGGTNSGGAQINTTEYASLNAGGSGMIGAWTTSPASITTARSGHGTIAYKGYLYVLGGKNSSNVALSDVQYAPINGMGVVGAWTTLSGASLPVALYGAGFAVRNGYIYAAQGTSTFVGANPSAGTNASYYARVNADGTLGTWQTGTAMLGDDNPGNGLHDGKLAVYKSYLYHIGGSSCTGNCPTSRIQYASIGSDGSIGAWAATTSLPVATEQMLAFAANGYLYSIGGLDAVGTVLSSSSFIAINSDGTLDATWKTAPRLPLGRYGTIGGVSNGYVYVSGGYVGLPSSALTNMTYYAELLPFGYIGSWRISPSVFTNPRQNAGGALHEGYMHMTGGSNASTQYASVESTPLSSSARVAKYSKVIDLGGDYALTSLSYNGLLADGDAAVSVRTANGSGVFGSSQWLSDVAAQGALPVNCINNAAVRYVMAIFDMDDSQVSSVIDTTVANVTDFTVTYNQTRASPDIRLRGGKFFATEIQQPLDTCNL